MTLDKYLSALIALALIALLIALAWSVCGCATQPIRTTAYLVPETVVMVGGDEARCWPGLGLIIVPWGSGTDTSGQSLPDFEALGHEVWHIVEGAWHE